MAIEHFTKEEFDTAVPVGTEHIGLINGEHVYSFAVDEHVSIQVRSSIHQNGHSARTGEDSIRGWMVETRTQKPIASKVAAYTTRVSGWQNRFFYSNGSILKTLILWRWRAGDCEICHHPRSIFEAGKDAKNPGRKFAKCLTKNCPNNNKWFGFVDQSASADDLDNLNHFVVKQSQKAAELVVEQVAEHIEQVAERVAIPALDFLSSEPHEVVVEEIAKVRREPNMAQRQAIESPVDANIRVLAGPGSGKTFLLVERYCYLVEHGISPDNILAVTFSKSMADELLAKVIDALPEVAETAAMQQICTIHAICYRILKANGDKRNVAKEWEEKKILQKIAELLWKNAEARPGYKEILYWINAAKFMGLPAHRDHEFFVEHLDNFHGLLVDEARRLYDNQMQSSNFLTFSDMLFDIEQKLIHDAAFRNELQSKFTHVVVDESQDVSEQNLRILITLSFSPGENPVYEQ